MKYKCLIVDDEKLGRDLIKSYVSHFPYLEVGAECGSAMEALQLLANNHFDLMFLDINMPLISGIELLKQSSNLPLTILCTAYSEYALESYELNVVDYLLKPIEFIRFSKAISKAMEKLNTKQTPQILSATKEEKNTSFFVKSEYKKIKIVVQEIKYIEAMEKYIRIHTNTEKTMTLMSMSKVMDNLPPDQFIRIHRSYIVNKNKIDMIEGNMVVIDGNKIPISKANRKMIHNLL